MPTPTILHSWAVRLHRDRRGFLIAFWVSAVSTLFLYIAQASLPSLVLRHLLFVALLLAVASSGVLLVIHNFLTLTERPSRIRVVWQWYLAWTVTLWLAFPLILVVFYVRALWQAV